jgi:hypothetical protein
MVQAMNNVFNLPQPKLSLTERLAAYFRARPGCWIDGRELSTIAGSYAWRTRLSELRRAPFFMRIGRRVGIHLFGRTDHHRRCCERRRKRRSQRCRDLDGEVRDRYDRDSIAGSGGRCSGDG